MEINLALEAVNEYDKREFYLLMADDGKYTLTHEMTCRSGRVYKFPVDISFAQWNAIRNAQDDLMSSYIALKFQCRDLLETFKMGSKRILPVHRPVGPDCDEAEKEMNHLLTCVLYKNIGHKKGIEPPKRIYDEGDVEEEDLVPVKDFNESCLCLNVYGMIRDFERELNANKLHQSDKKLISFLSEAYLKAIRLDVCIAAARKDFCSLDG